MTSDPYRGYRRARILTVFLIGGKILATVGIIMALAVFAAEVHKRGLKPILDELWNGPSVTSP